jgi:hypothetical protein
MITQVPMQGYPRGLAITDDCLAVGISRRRNSASDGYGSIKLLDKFSLEQKQEVTLPFKEVYDVLPINSQLAARLKQSN